MKISFKTKLPSPHKKSRTKIIISHHEVILLYYSDAEAGVLKAAYFVTCYTQLCLCYTYVTYIRVVLNCVKKNINK